MRRPMLITKINFIILVILIFVVLNYFLYTFSLHNRMKWNVRGRRELNESVDKNRMDSSVILLTLLATRVISAENLVYTWKCTDDKCVKSEYPILCKNEDIYKTLNVCQLICGPYGALWPQPTVEVNLSKDIIPVHPDLVTFHFKNLAEGYKMFITNELMTQMSETFIQDMKTLCSFNCSKIFDTQMLVKIAINSPEFDLTWATDESYNLHVKTDGYKIIVSIRAITVFGARNGLQTLFQLMTNVRKNNTNYLVMIKEAFIIDKPVYPHRGLLIDTSRHYLHVNTIKRTLDAMGHSKLNLLHWHATDTQSFPLKLPRIPELAKLGAYSVEEIYTLQDISEIINYGKKRGVRIILEIDSPAHAGNGWQWGEIAGLGELAVCLNKNPWRNYCIQPPCGQLNPVNPNVYKILGLIYKDLVTVFPKGEIFHVGGDEVFLPCWNSSHEIIDYMRENGLGQNTSDFLHLWSNFHGKFLQILDDIIGNSNNPVILWSSHLTLPENIEKYLSNKRFIIQTWVESTETSPNELLSKGYKLIVSTKDAWYLDHGFWGKTVYYNWAKVYDNRIPNVTKGVYGGEVCMWGEYVDDASIDSRIWPRAAAAAERLWSNPDNDASASLYRFLQHRERLIKIGIQAEAIIPQWCYQNEGLCQ